MRKTFLLFLSTIIHNSSCSKDEEELNVAGFYVADASEDMLNASTFVIEKQEVEYIFTAYLTDVKSRTSILYARFYNIPSDDVIHSYTDHKYGHVIFTEEEL